jgi:hypothetical protein
VNGLISDEMAHGVWYSFFKSAEMTHAGNKLRIMYMLIYIYD